VPAGLAVGLARATLGTHQGAIRPGETWVPRFPVLSREFGIGDDISTSVAEPSRSGAHILLLVSSDRAQRILARVRATPAGFVRTYGDVSPGAPRVAGAVLFSCEDPALPWHRIVRADGSLAKGERQRHLLRAEGVPFRGERVNLCVARLPE
jgi:methylated-DNA-protein-cysteine methyltransferase-like protein